MAKRGSGMKRNSKVVWPGYTEVETRHVVKIGRNEPCPCESGKKYKDCHEREGEAYLQKLAFERDKETSRVLQAYLLDAAPGITGDYLTDARVGFDRQQRPIVEFQFNAEGGRIFAEFTSANLQEQLAIVLDERVYSAPTIRARIGARGQIEGRFSAQEAADLAVVLRSGSLPVLTFQECLCPTQRCRHRRCCCCCCHRRRESS